MLQFTHCTNAPQLLHSDDQEYPRRLISTIACVFSSRRRAIAARSDSETGPALCCALEFLAQINHAHVRQRPVRHPRSQFQQMIFSGARVVISLERRRRRAQQRHRAFQLRAIHRRIAPVVARRFFLLVAGLLLFVDDDQAQILEWRKNGGARAHHDCCFAAAHPPPFARSFRRPATRCAARQLFRQIARAPAARPTASTQFPAPARSPFSRATAPPRSRPDTLLSFRFRLRHAAAPLRIFRRPASARFPPAPPFARRSARSREE